MKFRITNYLGENCNIKRNGILETYIQHNDQTNEIEIQYNAERSMYNSEPF